MTVVNNKANRIIDCNAITLKELLERKYIVPLYQRPYEWTNNQLEKLYEEVEGLFDEKDEVAEDDFLFFGSMQFNKTEEGYEIVDGQQRLITFVLFVSAMLDKPFAFKNNELIIDNCTIKFNNNVKENVIRDNYKYYCTKAKKSVSNIVEKVYFAEVVTNSINEIEKLLNIFNSMNMEGLPLQREDIFKTKCAGYFKGADSEQIIACINDQYKKIYDFNLNSKTCELSEHTIIDVFRYLMVQNAAKIQKANLMKDNSISLLTKTEFVDDEKCNIRVFEEITNTIIRTQEVIDSKNGLAFKHGMEMWFARELIGESRYWNLRNIMYYIVYKISKVKGDPSEEEIKKALNISEKIWQYCSIYRAGAAKVINKVYNKIIDEIIVPTNILWKYEYLSNEISEWYYNEFKKCFDDDCFNSNLPHLMTILSYFDDAIKHNSRCFEDEKVTIGMIKEQIFYRELSLGKKNKHIEIEHILSRSWFDENKSTLINSIGNLMYLERNINRAIGEQLGNKKSKTIHNYTEDIEKLKFNVNNEERLCYKNSNLVCVKEVLSQKSDQDYLVMIEKRKNEKKEYINRLYSQCIK